MARVIASVAVIGAAGLVAAGCLSTSSTSAETRPAGGHGPSRPAKQPPAPATYAETCQLVTSWCTPVPGRIPARLRRSLHLPSREPGASCPTTPGKFYRNDQFGGIALGRPPVRPLISPSRGRDLVPAKRGLLHFSNEGSGGWFSVKTLWFALPSYRGPVFIRGRQLDGPLRTTFGESPVLVDPQLPPGPTINGRNGFREWPGATWLRGPGCYAWQIDGTTFSTVVVFEAKFAEP